jgi:hypothetical protein
MDLREGDAGEREHRMEVTQDCTPWGIMTLNCRVPDCYVVSYLVSGLVSQRDSNSAAYPPFTMSMDWIYIRT